jgi:cobalt-zinc-cadmium efflux system outer membrane protein
MRSLGLCCALASGLQGAVFAQPVSNTLALATAIEKALAASPKLGGAQAGVASAWGAERQAGAWENPEFDVEAANVAGNKDYKSTRSAEYTYSLSQKLEVSGKRALRKGVAQAEREASEENLQASRLDTIRDVTIAYGDVLAAKEKLALAEAREKLARGVLENVSQRVGAARDPLIYKSQADVALAMVRLERQTAVRNVDLTSRKLASFWKDKQLTHQLDSDMLEQSHKPEPLEFYQQRLAQNPDLLRYEKVVQSKESSLKLEKAKNTPDPSVQLGLRTFKESQSQAMVVGFSLPLPVLDRNKGNVEKARADILQADNEAEQAKLESEQQLHEAWQDWQSAYAEDHELKTRIIPAAKQALTLSREGYGRGRFSFLEVLNAQRTLAEAQEQQIHAEQRQLNARATVERLAPTPSQPPKEATLTTGDNS